MTPKRFVLPLCLAVSVAISGLAWRENWKLKSEKQKLQTENYTLRADKAELIGDIEDMKLRGEYFEKYSFQVVMGTLIKKSKQHHVPINVALALMQIESGFNPFAISSTGDYGLLQPNEYVWKFDKRKIFEPEINIEIGLKYLSKCYKRAGTWSMALALYNAGHRYAISEHPRKFSESIFMQR